MNFEEWAKDHLGQGYSLEKDEWTYIHPVTRWASHAYAAGQRAEREACLTICEELEEHWSGYKDTALLNGDWQLSNAASGEPRAAEAIAAVIRSRNSLDKP